MCIRILMKNFMDVHEYQSMSVYIYILFIHNDKITFTRCLNIYLRKNLQGFSFGGRVSLAIAANHPQLVKRLSVTGVPLERPALGECVCIYGFDYNYIVMHSSIYACIYIYGMSMHR
jgi:pimeloyl-ACP methyl ester carboxylesterase